MKRIIVLFIALVMLMIVARGCGGTIDRINPFVKTDDYYVLLKEDGKQLSKSQWEYTLTGYNKDGKKQEFVLLTLRHLRKGIYLKVAAKGENGKSFIEVKENEVPQKALEKIK
jgi:uncharacterized protein (TIGR01655 family)